MAVRREPEELSVREQQVEGWEEKLAQRARALVDSARSLQAHKQAMAPLLEGLKAVGGTPSPKIQQLLGADPLLDSPQVGQARAEAQAARRAALEARTRAAQAWEQELAGQAAALNAVLQELAATQRALQAEIDRRRAQSQPKPAPPPLPTAPPPLQAVNNRIHPRAQLKVQVDFESDHNFFTGFSSDISEGGLFVATVNIQPLGSPVEVAFALPSGEQVMARGRVRWVREADARGHSEQPGMGIQFEALSEDAREAVQQFISQREPLFYAD